MDQYVFPEFKSPLLDSILSVATQLEELSKLDLPPLLGSTDREI